MKNTSRRVSAAAAAGVLLATLVAPTAASAQVPGDEELFNLEHVFNFNPQEHDPQADEPDQEPAAGSDLEMFTHTVPLRDYETGELVDRNGDPLPAGAAPIMAERDFAVVGSFERGGYVFDITDPENTQFVTQVTCRQPRNDVGIKKFTDEATGETRVVLALTQQGGNPCPDQGAVGLRVDAPAELEGFHVGVQWGATAPVEQQAGRLVYAGTGCSAASYAPVATEIQDNIALVDSRVSATNPGDQCPTYSFFQKVRTAQEAGAIGFVQIPGEDEEPNQNATAVDADIPAIEVHRTDEVLAVRDAVIEGTEVEATLDDEPGDAPLIGEGSGGIGVFDITDPYEWDPMYRLLTNFGGVHNFIFHPTKPYGYLSNGALPGGIDRLPIVDFTDLDNPVVLPGPETEGGVHDVEFSPDGDRAYAASENNYRIYDTTDPANPELLSRTANVGSYAHGVFPSPDLEIMVTNNESLVLGGFLAPGSCPGEGLASYDITDEENPVGPLGYYTPDVVGPSPRPCTSHFGRFAPDTRILSMGWYIAGARVIDWSDPSNPVEIAGAVLEDMDTWAAKFHRGPYLYTGDIGRGFDVFRWSGEGTAPWQTEPWPPEGVGVPADACPADAAHDFTDVDERNVHNDAIACMAWREVILGFGDGTFQPDLEVRRDQTASFIARTLEAAGHSLPPPQDHGFTDIGGNPHADAINQLAEAGIVRGTSSTTYSPAASLRRDQVASFLVRAVEWARETTLEPEGGPYFADTAGNTHEQAIDIGFEQGLVVGRQAPSDDELGEYGPALPTTRAQMASLSARLLERLWSGG